MIGHQKKKAEEKEQGTFHINKNSTENQILEENEFLSLLVRTRSTCEIA